MATSVVAATTALVVASNIRSQAASSSSLHRHSGQWRTGGNARPAAFRQRSHGEWRVVTARASPCSVVAAAGPGILDKPAPTIEKPQYGEQVDLGKEQQRKMAPPYRVLLHNDDFNRREYVVQVLMKCIPSMTVDVAVNIMNEAHVNGLSNVIICGRDEAEGYCEALRGNGLISSIEPYSNCG
eukprot:jgi/Chlat1/6228/Chrsp44S05820